MEYLIAILCDDIARIVTSRKFTYSAILIYFSLYPCDSNTWIISVSKICTLWLKLWPWCPHVRLMLIIFFNYVNRADL